MNERIRQLADEAGLRFTQLMSNPMVPVVDGRETDLEKFAELIVGHAIECVRDVLRDENSDLSYGAASQVQKHLREFFGVEE